MIIQEQITEVKNSSILKKLRAIIINNEKWYIDGKRLISSVRDLGQIIFNGPLVATAR